MTCVNAILSTNIVVYEVKYNVKYKRCVLFFVFFHFGINSTSVKSNLLYQIYVSFRQSTWAAVRKFIDGK